MGEYEDIHQYNRENTTNYTTKLLSFVRYSENEKLIIVSNFDDEKIGEFQLEISSEIIKKWNLKDGTYQLKDKLYNSKTFNLEVVNSHGTISIIINPLESYILQLQ